MLTAITSRYSSTSCDSPTLIRFDEFSFFSMFIRSEPKFQVVYAGDGGRDMLAAALDTAIINKRMNIQHHIIQQKTYTSWLVYLLLYWVSLEMGTQIWKLTSKIGIDAHSIVAPLRILRMFTPLCGLSCVATKRSGITRRYE